MHINHAELPDQCDFTKFNVTGIEEVAPDTDGTPQYAVSLHCGGCGENENRMKVRGVGGGDDAINNAKATFILRCKLSE